MSAPKKWTKELFDHLKDPKMIGRGKRAIEFSYGDLQAGIQFISELVKIRDRQLMSQHELAKKTSIAQSQIARLESGRANPTLYQLIKICRALKVKITLQEDAKLPPPLDDEDA